MHDRQQPMMPSYPREPPPSYPSATSTDDGHSFSCFDEKRQDPAGTEDLQAEQRFIDANIHTIASPRSSLSHYPKLRRPIAIPQIAIGSKAQAPMPITRAYASTLQDYGISQQDFLRIIDTLNVYLAAAPPFQVMGAAGHVIGFVPHEWALGVSAGLGVLAGAGTAATVYFRAKRFFAKCNREIFEPRGLHMSMLKDAELLDLLGLSESEVWDAMPATKIVKGLGYRGRVEALGDAVETLDFDVPESEAQRNWMDKLSAKQQARKMAKKDKKGKKRELKAERHHPLTT